MSREKDLGFVINLVTETCTFDGGFMCPVVTMLDCDCDVTLERDEAKFAIVKVPPDGMFVTLDLQQLRDKGLHAPTSH